MILQKPDIQTIDGITYQLNSDTPYTGKYTMYYDNGDKFAEINYLNGKEHGQSIIWGEDGRIGHKGNLQNGKRHGSEIYWYDKNTLSVKGNITKVKELEFGMVGILMAIDRTKVNTKITKGMGYGLIGILKKLLILHLTLKLKSKYRQK